MVLGIIGGVFPLPGSVDALTILLAARHRQAWLYYALMATAGAVGGGYITYWIGSRGGKPALERTISPAKAASLCRRFERWGFGTVFVSALLPPPFPVVPFLLTAGAMHYPRKKFMGALTIGRALRYTAEAWFGVIYRRRATRMVSRYDNVLFELLIAVLILSAVWGLWAFLRQKSRAAAAAQCEALKNQGRDQASFLERGSCEK